MISARVERWRLRGRLVHRAWRYRLRTEAAEVAFLRAHVSTGQVAVDVGAHRGALTYWMLTAVGRTGRVVAVEPIPELAAYLRRLGTEGGFDRLRVVESALSSASGTTTLHVPSAGYTGTASVVAQADGHTPVSVDMTTLDALCAHQDARPVGFIKCDVEGHELDVLVGAERVLREDRPVLLVESVDDRPTAGQTGRVFDHLRGLRYDGWFFEHGRRRSIDHFRAGVHQAAPEGAWHVNFGFVPRP